MEIESWQLSHPERLEGYQAPIIELDPQTKLLFISPELPHGRDAEFMGKVIKTMGLELEQCRHIFPNQLPQLSAHHLEWVWYAQCKGEGLENVKSLQSPALSNINGHNQNRRALWDQIKAYG
jgi:DNA polymerase-3 subunit psi